MSKTWLRIDAVPEDVPVRDKSGRLWQRHDGQAWTMNSFGGWYTPDFRPPIWPLRKVENPGWWMRLGAGPSGCRAAP